ncbi:ABC transporter substrate-binding protein [Burkholderiaceae bacterium UC74_6]
MRAPNHVALSRRRALMGAGCIAPLAALGALTALAGCRRSDPLPGTDEFSVAVPSVPHAGLVHLASSRGRFEANGLAVKLLPQTHGKAALGELLASRAELAVVADVPVVVEVLKGAKLEIVATIANSSNELAVVARRDRGVGEASQLANRRIGVTFGTSGEYFLWAFLVHHRIPPQSVQLIDLPPGGLIAALRTGEVDAIAAWQPVRHEAELALGSTAVSLKAPDAYAQGYVLVGLKNDIESRQPAFRRFLQAMLDAERFVREQPEQAKSELAGLFKISPATLGPSWEELTLEVELQQAQLVTLEDVASWAMARGYAPLQPMPNFLSALSLDALLAVDSERVTVVR